MARGFEHFTKVSYLLLLLRPACSFPLLSSLAVQNIAAVLNEYDSNAVRRFMFA
jgi:hypothetical protein